MRLHDLAFMWPLLASAWAAVMTLRAARAAVRERRLTADALRRNRELEAFTGLATTLTELLNEASIKAQGLQAISVAARCSSSALHTIAGDALVPAASGGEWTSEERVVGAPPDVPATPRMEAPAGRHVARIPLTARARPLGVLTLVRSQAEGPFPEELSLLRLLADQLAVALQNARDSREKIEAALRDPLTGLCNRRYFYEALGQEIARHERYGTGAALALFDLDDFKAVNDEVGGHLGDEVLNRVGELVNRLTRPTDIFARIGGEEFRLLMPETSQLEALLVAERCAPRSPAWGSSATGR